MKKIIFAVSVMCFFSIYSSIGIAEDVDERYPPRLPDWLWDTPATAHLLSSEDVLTLRGDIAKCAQLKKVSNSMAADSLKDDIARRLSIKFTVRDLAVGAFHAQNPRSRVALAVRIDPSFNPSTIATIQSAVERFLEVALDQDVINRAIERSTTTPSPMPDMFEIENGKRKLDEIGRPVLTSAHKLFLKLRVKPIDATLFSAELRNALAHASGEPALLVVSKYSGNPWWGTGYYNHFSDPVQQLGRESPPRGYFYIQLNSEKFAQGEAGWNDPDFWASKIGHELLHNLGYWHPNYESLKERDNNNKDKSWSFLVSYENAIFERLKGGK